ncbi:acyl-CoA dehydrogenase family protein [Actinomadura chokoriensis]|uniref:Acyl-CoA dehydrogenase family protein n=1 Tax=Actinomadura chokoriensis TaxID=454156 RepID=A0ABV4R3G2_9ACTN
MRKTAAPVRPRFCPVEFDWTVSQRNLYEKILSGVRAGVGEGAGDGRFSRDAWRTCGGLGLLGLSVPAEYGGEGLDAVTTARAVEAFGRGTADFGLLFAAMAHLFACAMPIAEHGRAELRARVLPALCSGEWIGANAITEEQAGSDVGALQCTAERQDGHYRLNGPKSFVSNGPVADVFIVYAVTDPGLGHLGISAFAVERGTPGLDVGEPFTKMGLASCAAGEIVLTDCLVPEGNLLGNEGQGSAIFQSSMRWERGCLFAGYLGMIDRLLERCVAHARTRRQFGGPIGGNQAVSHRLADMKLQLEAARLLLYRACWAMDRGAQAVLEISLSKLAVSEAAVQSALTAIQIFGGGGYLTANQIEQELRNAVPSTLFSGTSEMQREIISREIGL